MRSDCHRDSSANARSEWAGAVALERIAPRILRSADSRQTNVLERADRIGLHCLALFSRREASRMQVASWQQALLFGNAAAPRLVFGRQT